MPNNDNRRRFGRDRSYINMSGKVNGKSYELIDVENLKEANKQMAELIKKQQEYINQQDKKIRNQEEISVQEREYYRNNKKNIEDMTRRIEENNKVISGWNRNIRSNLINNPNKDNLIGNLMSRSANNQQVPKTITDLLRYRMEQSTKKSVNDIYDKTVKSVVNSYKRKGADFSDPAVMNRVNKDIQDRMLANDEFNKITKKFGMKADLFNFAVSTFNSAVKTWVGVATKGLHNQRDVFNDTFENISVRNGTTRSQYYSAQKGLQGQLSSMGLFNNIASSEVQTMWNTLASNGIKIDLTNAEQTARAIETVVTKHIVPYLDLTSSSAQTIVENNPAFLKQVRGIGVATNEIVGSATFITQHLQELVDDIAPMAQLAENEIGLQFAQLSGSYETLRNEYGLNDAQIGELYRNTAAIYNNPYQALTRGTLDQKMAVAYGLSNNIDFKDISAVDRFARSSTNYLSNLVPEGNLSSLYGGLLASNGIVGISGMASTILNEKNIDMNYVTSQGIKVANSTSGTSNRVTNNFAGDVNQTQKRLQDVTMENFMNGLAVWEEKFGNWTDIIVNAIKGIGALITAKVIGGVIGKGMGMLTGQNGLALPKLGGIASTIGSVLTNPLTLMLGGLAATVAGIYAINKHQDRKNIEGNDSTGERQNNAVEAYMSEGLNEDAAYFKAIKENTAIRGNIGIWRSDSEVPIEPVKREKMLNGQWVSTPTSIEKADDATQLDILAAFNGYDEERLKSEFGIELGWWFWEKDKHMKAREALNDQIALGKSADPSKYNKIKAAALLNLLNNNSDKINYGDVAAALNLMLYYENKANDKYVTDALEYMSIRNYATSKEKMKQMLDGMGITEVQTIKNAYKLLTDKQVDFYLMDTGRNFFPYPNTEADYEKMKKDFNLHRYGLASVPYDEYPALLHQGEAVLTATTAAELRNLLEEYRQTSQQSVNFDNIIQRQTTALLGKMDSIIKTIESSKVGTFNNTDSMHKAKELLADSMRYMTSTKSF